MIDELQGAAVLAACRTLVDHGGERYGWRMLLLARADEVIE